MCLWNTDHILPTPITLTLEITSSSVTVRLKLELEDSENVTKNATDSRKQRLSSGFHFYLQSLSFHTDRSRGLLAYVYCS